jgi:hypothetical protein
MRRWSLTDSVRNVPDPARRRLLRSVFEPSPLTVVAEAVSAATEHETRLYVERLPEGWRWSLAHRGGSYPLLRITARFLQVDYHKILIGFRTLPDGISVLCADPSVVRYPEAAALIDFTSGSSPASVERRIVDVLGDVAL